MIQSMLELNLLQTEKWPAHSFDLPKYQSHRGFCKNGAQENTLNSLIEAKQMGFAMAEFDILLTRDNVPVLFHDLNLRRVAKRNFTVRSLDFSELKKIIPITSLEEVLQSKEVPDFLNVEIKSGHLLYDPLAIAVAKTIKKNKSQSRVLISCFNPWCLLKVKSLLPEVPLALLATDERVKKNALYLRRMWTVPLLRPHILHLDHEMLNEDFLRLIQNNNLSVASWTVNDKNRSEYLLESGVRSIITDENLV